MLKQEVAFVPTPATLLMRRHGERRILLDGQSSHSWGDGAVVFAADPAAVVAVSASSASSTAPLAELQRFVDHWLARGCAGVLVALSYELKHWIECLPRRHPWPSVPLIYAAAYDWAYVANRRSGCAEIVATDGAALASGLRSVTESPPPCGEPLRVDRLAPMMAEPAYIDMVERAKHLIAAGDIYQANLSQSFESTVSRHCGPGLFARWTTRYPAPFAAYVDGGDWALLGNSPECFLDIRNRSIATFPIKGTRRVAPGADIARLAADLAGDPKDLAEHLMIVDLERNDLGRICVPGSIVVSSLQEVCEFPLLLHMVSRVAGTMREGIGLGEIVRATFPGGSITGAPKVRAMEIIEELEPTPRGFYTGSVGWLEPSGRSRFNICIRTAVLRDDRLSYHAGGGIVADSDPRREYEETFAKAQTLFESLAEPESGTRRSAGTP
jgi:anthranilate/para-aminobenzoate synthase component I